MASALTRLSGSAFEITLTVPWSEIKTAYDQVYTELASEIEIEGFRKGKAPKELVEKQINKNSVYEEVINRILPKTYSAALDEHHLKPIVNPQVKIVSGEEEKDWQFIAKAAEKPEVNLDDYKKHVQEINAKGKIWTPDQGIVDANKVDKDKSDEEKTKRINDIIDKLLETCSVDLPEIMVESEVNRLMTQLIDDVRAAGLTYEQYLTSKSTTNDQIREQYVKQVTASLKLELILQAVADDQGIVVDEKELAAVIDQETDPKKKESLKSQSYYLSSLLRREKTLTKLSSL